MNEEVKQAQQLALWADRLRDVSAMGLQFSENPYDIDNYKVVQEIAMSLLAMATGDTLEELKPLLAPIFARPTPLCVGDAAVIDDEGRILLIQRSDTSLWAMPGGALEVGETPAAGATREAWEETGLRAEAVSFVGVHDSRLSECSSRHHLYHFLFLCRPIDGTVMETPSHAAETLDVAWFEEGSLPAEMEHCHAIRIPEAYRVWRGDKSAFFDR